MMRVACGDWFMLVANEPAPRAAAQAVAQTIIEPVVARFPDLRATPPVVVPCLDRPDVAADEMRRLYDAEVVFAEVTGSDSAVLYHLGARDLLAERLTLVFHKGPASSDLKTIFAARLIEYEDGKAEAAQAALKRILTEDLPRADDQASSLLRKRLSGLRIGVNARPASPDGDRAALWAIHPADGGEALPTRIGIWRGDIQEITHEDGIHALVNPENTYFEMARIHDRGVSGLLRFLGSNWSNNNLESDDIIYRDLIAKAGTRRPAAPGTAIVTTAGRLRSERGVEAIAHVAAVAPAGGAGRGYEPIQNLDACVREALKGLEARWAMAPWGKQDRTVLIPLVATGNGGGDARAISRTLISEAVRFAQEQKPRRIGRILFLAYTDLDFSLCAAVMNAHPQLRAGTA